jgi:hypothetical protein
MFINYAYFIIVIIINDFYIVIVINDYLTKCFIIIYQLINYFVSTYLFIIIFYYLGICYFCY